MFRPHAMTIAFAASIAVHLALVAMLPGLRLTIPVTVERLVEVELKEQEPVPEPTPILPAPKPVTPPPPAPISPGEADALTKALARSIPDLPASLPPAPPVRLPTRQSLLPEPETIPWRASPAAAPEPVPTAPATRSNKTEAADLAGATAAAEALLKGASPSPDVQGSEETPTPMQRLEIEGQVGQERRLVFEPPRPKVSIGNPADVRIQFWVSPRGEVIRTVPLQVGDPEYDSAAMDYVRKFRFNALPAGDEREQQGTIRVKFRLQPGR